jgi:two-component sensor histidine kinase
MSGVLRNLVDNLCVSYSPDPSSVSIDIDAEQVLLPIDISIPLGLIINELVSNTFKHAFPEGVGGNVEIIFKRQAADSLQLIVADNGQGIADDFDMENTSSLGLQLIQLLSEQISAELSIQRSNPTRFELSIPVPGSISSQ